MHYMNEIAEFSARHGRKAARELIETAADFWRQDWDNETRYSYYLVMWSQTDGFINVTFHIYKGMAEVFMVEPAK